MKIFPTLIVVSLPLAGCGPTTATIPWRDGASYDQVGFVSTQCEVLALQQVPVAMSTTVTPRYTTPANVQCTTIGNITNCHDYGSQSYGGNVVTEDVNLSLRDRLMSQCLASQGIHRMTVQRCTSEQAARVNYHSTVYPPASRVECVTENGAFVLRKG